MVVENSLVKVVDEKTVVAALHWMTRKLWLNLLKVSQQTLLSKLAIRRYFLPNISSVAFLVKLLSRCSTYLAYLIHTYSAKR